MKSSRFERETGQARLHRVVAVCLLTGSWSAAAIAAGADFDLSVSPPRYELQAQPGQIVRQHLDLINTGAVAANYVFRTADWAFAADASVEILPPELAPGSCRPWARLERKLATLLPGAQKKYRFEIHVPPDAPAGECRFALLIEQPDDQYDLVGAGKIRFPVSGRVAVVVYLAVGSATPKLSVKNIRMDQVNGHRIPVADIANSGNAHGRPTGVLEAEDAARHDVILVVAPLPVMAGETRAVPLWPQASDGKNLEYELTPPLKVKGAIEWEGGKYEVKDPVR